MVHAFEFKIKSKILKTKVKERFYFCIFPLFCLYKSLMFISHHRYHCIISRLHLLFTTKIKLQILAKGTSWTFSYSHAYITNLKCYILHQYASKFTLCFIRFLVKLNKFTMVKIGSLSINMDKLLWTSEFINN
jgi:hypothetical protein